MSPSHCRQCGTELAPALLVCPACSRLVYAEDLKRLAGEAEEAEKRGRPSAALATWRQALELLPPDSRQHETISRRIPELSKLAETSTETFEEAKKKSPWARRLGALGVVGVAIWKFKFAVVFLLTKGKLLLLGLTKTSTLLSMILSLGVYWAAWGWKFAAGIVASIYIHEMGHVAMLRRYGIAATAPMFIPGIGAVIRLKQYPTDAHESARVGLAGPMWGLATAAVCWGVFFFTGAPYWRAIATVGAWINLFNLLPIWQLDGGRGFDPLSRGQRWIAAGIIGVTWLVAHDGLLLVLLVAGLARAWAGGGAPAEGDRRAFWEYSFLVVALALLSATPVWPR